MHRFLLPTGMVLAALVAFDSVFEHRLRLAELERVEMCRPEQLVELRRTLEREHGAWRERLAAESESERALAAERERADQERIAGLEALVATQTSELEGQARELEDWRRTWEDLTPPTLRRRLFELQARGEANASEIEFTNEIARNESERLGRDLARLESRLESAIAPPSTEELWDELVGPVVQLIGDTTVGSGVLLRSRPQPDGTYQTHVLTAWHVVRDIVGKPDNLAQPVSIKVYSPDGAWRTLSGRTLARDVGLDLALLVLDTRERLPFGARLATREELAAVRTFDGVYAVGCPLGNDPIPTLGEIATTHHDVDGSKYWMISAPTYIGNSGGGIFTARSRVLVGIFSKIYTHGATRTTIVPHMGLATPLTVVYDWLDRTEYAFLETPAQESSPLATAAGGTTVKPGAMSGAKTAAATAAAKTTTRD